MSLGTMTQATDDRRRLATIAAVFWFEAVGALFVTSIVVLSPLSCFGDSFDGSGACADGVPPVFRDGSLMQWVAVLAGLALVASTSWLATRERPIVRAFLFSVLGLAAAVPVVLVAAGGGLLAVLPFFWTGIPSLLLVGSWLPVLAAGWRGRSPT